MTTKEFREDAYISDDFVDGKKRLCVPYIFYDGSKWREDIKYELIKDDN